MKKICCVVGARPNFMKIAPIIRAFKSSSPHIQVLLVHTGQHYDDSMNETFFRQLEIPKPQIHLEVGSGTHAIQTAEVMRRFEPVLDQEKPDAVLVVGDVNSTIACALVAAKKGIRIIHVEAGLRSFDRSMPEEINRILTDQLSDLLFTTEEDAENNLQQEGIKADKIHFVGNVMIDTLLFNIKKVDSVENICSKNNIPIQSGDKFGILTLHRPANVDDPEKLKSLLNVLGEISLQTPLIFPMHPRTSQKIQEANLEEIFNETNILRTKPLGYLELLGLMSKASLVLTDSGGLQEETTVLGIPCITLRENTERPITITQGTNILAGGDPKKILSAYNDISKHNNRKYKTPKYWDGLAAERIVETLEKWL
jgi:UDP-N-acetylglucosamine 2-epimerase (non-hydrolysing)